MTATMLLKFVEAQSGIENACEIVMNSLPVCQVRKISYSTFSAIDISDDGVAKIVEEGNPQFIWIHDNKVMEPKCEIINSKTFKNRHMHIYKIKLEENKSVFLQWFLDVISSVYSFGVFLLLLALGLPVPFFFPL